MAARRRVVSQNPLEIEEPEADLYDGMTPAEREAAETLADVLSAFRESTDDIGWNIGIHRISGNNKLGMGEPFLFNCAPEDLPIDERLRDKYGSGKYRARVYKNRRLFRSFMIEVEAPTKTPEAPSEMKVVLAAMQEQAAQTQALMREMMTQRQQYPSDPIDMLTKLMMLQQQLRPPVTEQVNPMELFTKGIEFARDLIPSGGGDTSAMDIVKEFVKSPAVAGMFAGMVNKGQPMLSPPENQSQPLLGPPTTGAPTLPPNPAGMTQEQTNNLIRQQVGFLIAKAKGNSDPTLYAEFIYDNVPEQTLNYLLSSPNIIGELTAIAPEVGNHVAWFQQLLDAVRTIDETEKNGDDNETVGASV